VVVVCEKCETRFHLDEARIPAEGAQVRCSRCTHSFFITPPGSGDTEVIDEVVAEVTGAGEKPVPEAARDHLDPSPKRAESDLRGDKGPVEFQAEGHSPGDQEEVWEFNDDSPAHDQGEAEPEFAGIGEFDASALNLAGEAPLSEIETDDAGSGAEPESDLFAAEESLTDSVEKTSAEPIETSLIDPVESIRARDAGLDFSSPDDLGSPENWDFVGTIEAEPPLELTPEDEASEPLVPRADESGSAPHSPAQAESHNAQAPAAEESDQASLAARFTGIASIASWLVVALAFSVGMSALFTQPGEGSAVSAGPAEIRLSDLPITAKAVKGRLVENALAGNLLIVSGELENTGSDAVTLGRAVWVQLVSARGEPIVGATAVAGRAVAEASLREWDPDRLRLDLERSAAEMAHRSFRPGARISFDAVFESVPEAAAGWVLQTATSPSHLDPGNSLLSTTPPASE
jgi:predicted Zn finger-like uncharacterized protein